MSEHACAVCPRTFEKANARAQHERRAHPDWTALPGLAAERARAKKAHYLEANPGAGAAAGRRYREAHPERAAESDRVYREGHRLEQRQRTSAWRKSDSGREHSRAVRQRQIAEGKHSARMAIQRALDAGELTRKPCQVCGIAPAEAHHHLGYEREHWLDVQWLCDLHHAQAHKGGGSTMGKIVATYLVKVTLREPDDLQAGVEVEEPFTNDELVALVKAGIAEKLGELTVNATSERTDR